jgi:peptidoglycan/LPS O-acetylase OafA/YrhL
VAGSLTVAYLLAALFFARFWRQTRDRLFRTFAVAFVLLALNQMLASALGAADERTGYTYVLRVLGFLLILYAIWRKNVAEASPPKA